MIQSIYKKFRYDSKNTALSIKITIVSIIIVMAVFGIVHIVYATSVDTKDEKTLSYVSVCINKDDTLWGRLQINIFRMNLVLLKNMCRKSRDVMD